MEIQELLESAVNRAGVRTIFGEPVQAEGKTLIPVARIGFGFGFGAGHREQPAEGTGGGAGFGGRPVGVIEVTRESTRFIAIGSRRRMALALAAGFALGLAVSRRRVSVTVEKPRR